MEPHVPEPLYVKFFYADRQKEILEYLKRERLTRELTTSKRTFRDRLMSRLDSRPRILIGWNDSNSIRDLNGIEI